MYGIMKENWITELATRLFDEWGPKEEIYPQDKEWAKEHLKEWYGATEAEAEAAWNEYYGC